MSRAPAPFRHDAVWVLAAALAARLGVAAWAAGRFPPAGDGVYYDQLALRLAGGHGYTWLWPDGAVTYVAHYPVGYPALLAAAYGLFGASPFVAMAMNAVVSALAAPAVQRVAARFASRRAAAVAGLAVALHPGLVGYTPALMTEGVTAALFAVAVWATAKSADRGLLRLAALGAVIAAATFIRPQAVLLAPLLGGLAGLSEARGRAWRGPLQGAALATVVALALLAPWTARNGERMGRYALVSVNGGWNLLIGTEPSARGAWAPLEVPKECATVWDEAAKDTCFGDAAKARILANPWGYLALVPQKLGATFDYAGAAPWYLHASNSAAFGEDAKVALGAAETIYERLALLLALVGAALRAPARPAHAARLVALAGLPFALLPTAWPAYCALALAWLTRARARSTRAVAAGGLVLLATLATHAIFFGSGRYALVVFPLVTGLGLAELLGAGRAPKAPEAS